MSDSELMVECCVCFEETSISTKCNHALCLECYLRIDSKKCPMCRGKIPIVKKRNLMHYNGFACPVGIKNKEATIRKQSDKLIITRLGNGINLKKQIEMMKEEQEEHIEFFIKNRIKIGKEINLENMSVKEVKVLLHVMSFWMNVMCLMKLKEIKDDEKNGIKMIISYEE
jgi:hypothetical protein